MSTEGSFVDAVRGSLDASGLRVAVLVARFNAEITESLLRGAREALSDHGAAGHPILQLRPGAGPYADRGVGG